MLDFLSLKKNELACSLCGGVVHGDNCSPKGCSHAFHSDCFETWMGKNGLAEEYVCPAADCASKFSEITVRKTPFGLTSKVVSLKESHQCPICCEPLQVPVATPESCNHTFCYVCLREWSRVRHECPLDRGAFELILLSDKIGGPITKRVSPPPVQSPPPEDTYEELDTNCEICSSPEDEAHLLLCDHCDRGFHTYCLPVPLNSIPPGDWYCPDCVRHGIGRNGPATRTRTRRSRISSAAADDEAVEHDQNEWNSDLSDDPGDETFHLPHELSNESQERLARRARRRHRGARLLQDTISQLAERVLSEVSQREQRRRDHRRHARTQLTSHTRTRDDDPSRSVCPSEHMEIRRRRLFVLSDESSDEEAIGIPLRLPNLKRDFCRRNFQAGQSSNSEVAQEPSAKRSRLDSSEVKTQDAPSVGPSSSGPTENVSQATPSFQQSSSSNGTDAQLNCQPTSSTVYSSTKASTRTREKTKKKRKLRSKKRVVTRASNGRPLKLRKRKKKLTKTQRRIRRGILERSGISSPTKSPRNIRSSLRSSNNVLPRLSILGAEPTCSLFVEDSTPDDTSLPGTKNENHPTDKFRPPAPTLLREIVANQASMFQFTTRHMHVNSDHSMSPIPVNEVESTVESVHTSVVQNSSTESRPTSASSSKQQKTAKVLTPSPLVVTKTKVNNSHSENIAPERHVVGCTSTAEIQCKSNSPFLQGSEVTTLLTPSTSHNTSSENQKGWDSEKLQYVRAILKANLKPSLVSGRIDKPTYEHIFDRAIYKIQQKDATKVTDVRIQKLAKQYIEYCRRHKVVSAD